MDSFHMRIDDRIIRAMQALWIVICMYCVSISAHIAANNEAILLTNTGTNCLENGDLQCAQRNYEEAIKLQFNFDIAHYNYGICLENMKFYEAAAHHYRQAAIWATSDEIKASALMHMAIIAYRYRATDSEIKKSVEILKIAKKLNPDDDAIAQNLGLLYSNMGMHEHAVDLYEELVLRNPSNINAAIGAGNGFYQMGTYATAIEWYRKAINMALISVGSDSSVLAQLYGNVGGCYKKLDDMFYAEEAFKVSAQYAQVTSGGTKVVRLKGWALSNLWVARGMMCEWRGMEELEHELGAALKDVVTVAADDQATYAQVAPSEWGEMDSFGFMFNRYASIISDRLLAEVNCLYHSSLSSALSLAVSNSQSFDETRKKTLRVGYLSGEWRDHPTGRLSSWLVTHHNGSIVSSLSISYSADDQSDALQYIISHSPEFVDLSGHSTPKAASIIASHTPDILVDLSGLQKDSRAEIPAMKPAAVVVNYLGYPGTTGCVSHDFIIADRWVLPPEVAESVSERIVYVFGGRSYQANNMPLHISPCSMLSGKTQCRERMLHSLQKYSQDHLIGVIDIFQPRRLREVNVLLCAMNSKWKFEPHAFTVWMNILRRVPTALLLVLSPGRHAELKLILEAATHGISPNRIIFLPPLPWKDHLYRSAACDMMLDTFTVGAHTTAAEMLWQWVPIITLHERGSGRTPSRIAASLVNSVGNVARLLVAYTVQEYENIAIRLCYSSHLRGIKASIAENHLSSATFDKFSFQKSMEQTYQQIWEVRRYSKVKEQKLFHILGASSPPRKSAKNITQPSQLQTHARHVLEELKRLNENRDLVLSYSEDAAAALRDCGTDISACIDSLRIRVGQAI